MNFGERVRNIGFAVTLVALTTSCQNEGNPFTNNPTPKPTTSPNPFRLSRFGDNGVVITSNGNFGTNPEDLRLGAKRLSEMGCKVLPGSTVLGFSESNNATTARQILVYVENPECTSTLP